MASDKQVRKAEKARREKQNPQAGPYRSKDGDRRHRGGPTYRDVMAGKMAELLPSEFLNPPKDEE